jgi:nucleoside 2-deoxyribosyltransferase
MPNSLKFFVASAFGRPDVDAIYDKVIRPVLRELAITPLRVDRVEHNDDIDDKIFELLGKADFCITDLTYARPSAYFEAGYAAGGGRSVIYMARRDHFKDKPDDPNGNLKVHFDLQMKNIIGWQEPHDTLKKALLSRVRRVVQPLLLARRVELASRKAIAEFAGKSYHDQLDAVTEAAFDYYKSVGYVVRKPNTPGTPPRGEAEFCVERLRMKRWQQVCFLAQHRFDKNLLRAWGYAFKQLRDDRRKFDTTDCILVLAFLGKTSKSQIARLLPKFKPIGDNVLAGDSYSRAVGSYVPVLNYARRNVAIILDGILSVETMRPKLAEAVAIVDSA